MQRYRSLFFLFFLLMASTYLNGQKVTVYGYVEDVDTGEKLFGASVYDAITFDGTTTNEYGFFSITLPVSQIKLKVSYLGYKDYEEEIDLKENKEIIVKLKLANELEEVVLVADKVEKIQENTQMSSVKIPISQIKSLPTIGGEVDILKALQLLPGVKSGNEASAGIYVRGGGPDQNLILLDGVPVYNVYHLFGFYSVFNADAIKSVELFKGGFPSRFGGRLSSVLDIRMKEGNNKEFHGEASIGLISSKLTLEGPIVKNRTSFMVSARRTYLDILARPFIKKSFRDNGEEGVVGYYFYDINAKINHKITDKDKLYLSLYSGRDKFYMWNEYSYGNNDENFSKIKANFGWGNLTSSLRWNHQFNAKLFGNTTLTFTKYGLLSASEFEEIYEQEVNSASAFEYASDITDYGIKFDLDWIPHHLHNIRYGGNAVFHNFQPGVMSFKGGESGTSIDTSFNQQNINAGEFYVFAEDDYEISKRLKANLGIHTSMFTVNNKNYYSLEPRVSARYLLNEKSSIKASYCRMTQYLHLLSNSSINLPTDLWVPPTENIKPQKSWQAALGWAYSLKDIEFSIETYYKQMTDMLTYKDGTSFLLFTDSWEKKVAVGKGDAYGGEFFVQKKFGKTTGWIGYTLSWTNRQFDDINYGKQFPYKYDRRHDVSFVITHHINKRIDISGTWVYGTGNAITLPKGQYNGLPNYYTEYNPAYDYLYFPFITDYGERNSYRMKAYHRMDIGINFHRQMKHWERIWSLSFYNLYNRKNPFYIYLDYNYETDKNEFKQVSLFPIIPSFSYAIKF